MSCICSIHHWLYPGKVRLTIPGEVTSSTAFCATLALQHLNENMTTTDICRVKHRDRKILRFSEPGPQQLEIHFSIRKQLTINHKGPKKGENGTLQYCGRFWDREHLTLYSPRWQVGNEATSNWCHQSTLSLKMSAIPPCGVLKCFKTRIGTIFADNESWLKGVETIVGWAAWVLVKRMLKERDLIEEDRNGKQTSPSTYM